MGDPEAACTGERVPEKAAPEVILQALSSSDMEEDGVEQTAADFSTSFWRRLPKRRPGRLQMWIVKRDDDMTMSCHSEDTTAGGGRGIVSNAHGDVPMSILQHKGTRQTRSTTTITSTTTTTTTTMKKRRKEQQQEGDTPRYPLTSYKNSRCLNNGGRLDELLKEVAGCKCDAVLLSEPWRQRKIDVRVELWSHLHGRWWLQSKSRSRNTLEQEVDGSGRP